jgi:hypothetical protein
MRYYRIALISGIISAFLVVSAFSYYCYSRTEVNNNRTKLEAILATNAQRKDYVKKMEAIKAYSQKLIALSHEGTAEVNYEIVLTDHDVKKLLSEVTSTYSSGLFFLDKGTIESTQAGITVTLKGFKMGGQ